jgi:GH35 family endo-1,4-beta-xylanase
MTHRQQTQKVHDLHKTLRLLRTRYEDKKISWDTYNECVEAINLDLVELGERRA